MSQMPHYSADDFPKDFLVSILMGVAGSLPVAALTWYGSRRYLESTYYGHPELNSAALVAGCFDGVLVGLGIAVFTFAARIWYRERQGRQRSDELLKRTLDEMTDGEGGLNDRLTRGNP